MSAPGTTSALLIQTPLGYLRAEATNTHILRIEFPHPSLEATRSHPQNESNALTRLEQELREYFAGKRKYFTVPIREPSGTSFQQQAWRTLNSIPYGKTISYQEQAVRMGNPRAIRAVGSANAANPLPLLIPCHRVIRRDGSHGGYAGGEKLKRSLLDLEQGLSRCNS
jgi:methylated-DNA-[protein]-cysteine S-methyltransferase